jgi:uncharacterized protein YqeY
MLYDKINKQLKEAMRNKNSQLADTLRVIKSRISEYLVQERMARDTVSDEVVVKVLFSYKKSLEKAVDQLSRGGDKAKELIAEYKMEIELCEQYLPEVQYDENLEAIVEQAIADLGVSDAKQVGRVMGYIMKNNSGLDGKVVKDLVSKKLGS